MILQVKFMTQDDIDVELSRCLPSRWVTLAIRSEERPVYTNLAIEDLEMAIKALSAPESVSRANAQPASKFF